MTQPTRAYLEERIRILEGNYARSQRNMTLEIAALNKKLANLSPENKWEYLRQVTVETVIMWRHTYGRNSSRKNEYTFTAIKRSTSVWQLSSGARVTFDTLCSDYLDDANDGVVYLADHFSAI